MEYKEEKVPEVALANAASREGTVVIETAHVLLADATEVRELAIVAHVRRRLTLRALTPGVDLESGVNGFRIHGRVWRPGRSQHTHTVSPTAVDPEGADRECVHRCGSS